MRDWPRELARNRLGWWAVGLALLVVLWQFATAFVGTFVLALFIYYGSRPVQRRYLRATGSRTASATLTILTIVIPGLVLLGYVGLVAFREFAAVAGEGLVRQVVGEVPLPPWLDEALSRPLQYVSSVDRLATLRQHVVSGLQTVQAMVRAVVHVSLALAISFFLLRDGDRVETWFRKEVAGDGTVPHAYLSGVDADLETVYFGNVVTVLLVTVLSVGVYNVYNLLVAPAVTLPFPTLLAVLTGLATFVPLLVGKIVYLPATAFLVWRALEVDAQLLWAPAAFLVVAFLLLDLLPQTVLRPIISGRELHSGLVLFAYVFGAAYFGWYGLFLGPLLLVATVQFLKVVFPELLHGEELDPVPSSLLQLGHDPTDGVEGDHPRHRIDATEDEGDPGAALDRDLGDNDSSETDGPPGSADLSPDDDGSGDGDDAGADLT